MSDGVCLRIMPIEQAADGGGGRATCLRCGREIVLDLKNFVPFECPGCGLGMVLVASQTKFGPHCLLGAGDEASQPEEVTA